MLVLKGHRGQVRSLTFSADGTNLASAAGHGRSISLWDLARGRRRTFLSGHVERVVAVAFAPSGSLLASLDSFGQVKVWDAAAARWWRDLKSGYHYLQHALSFAPDGRTLAVLYRSGVAYTVRRLEVATGKAVPGVDLGGTVEQVRWDAGCLAWAPQGQLLAVGCADGAVHLWDPATRELRHRLPHRGKPQALACSPDGRLVAVAGRPAVTLWDTATGERQAVLRGHTRMVTGVAFTPDGRLLASGSTDGQVKLWDVAGRAERAAFDWGVGPVHALALAPDGMRGACGGAGGAIAVWDVDV
jgi:WD40 repeat protein